MKTKNQQWPILRQKGIFHFVFFTGIAKWGLFFFTVFTLIPLTLSNKALTLPSTLLQLVICSITGILFSLIVWILSEKKFSQDYISEPDYFDIDTVE